jgi:hypothetical protein
MQPTADLLVCAEVTLQGKPIAGINGENRLLPNERDGHYQL